MKGHTYTKTRKSIGGDCHAHHIATLVKSWQSANTAGPDVKFSLFNKKLLRCIPRGKAYLRVLELA